MTDRDNFGYLQQATIKYKTYVKTALVEALGDVFAHHIDPQLTGTRVSIDFPRQAADYPIVLVRFFEREISNAGVGHEELINFYEEDGTPAGGFRMKHYFYSGDIEFGVYALSSLDRDLVSDTLVQTIAMGNLAEYTNRFLGRIYTDSAQYPDAMDHFININTDKLTGFGESQDQTPWGSEDDLIYKTSYRVSVFGEFYSVPPDLPAPLVEAVRQYPYFKDVEDVPTGDVNDGGEWFPPL